MNTMTMDALHQEDDALVVGYLQAERAYLSGASMSQEGLFGPSARLEKMREAMADQIVRMESHAALEEKAIRDAKIAELLRVEEVEKLVAKAKAERLAKAAAEKAEKAAAKAARHERTMNVIKGATSVFKRGSDTAKAGINDAASAIRSKAAGLSEHAAETMAHSAKVEPALKATSKFGWKGPLLATTGVLMLSAYALIAVGVGIAMVKIIQSKDKATASKQEVIKAMRAEITKASKPGMKVTVSSDSDDKLGKLLINGRPASEVRGEIEKILKSDKRMTPEEYQKAVKTVATGGHKFLEELDDLNRVAMQYQQQANISILGMVGMHLLFTPVSLVVWLGYRVYQYLLRKLS